MKNNYHDEPPPVKRTCAGILELRCLCLLIGLVIVVEESFQIGQKINTCRSAVIFESDDANWRVYRDLPIILALRIPALITAIFLVVGVRKVGISDGLIIKYYFSSLLNFVLFSNGR